MQAKTEMKIGANPPSINHSKIENSIRMPAPFVLLTNTLAHIVTITPRNIAKIPVKRKFGMTVKAVFRSVFPKLLRWTDGVNHEGACRYVALKQFEEAVFYSRESHEDT